MTTEEKAAVADLMIRTLLERLGDEVEIIVRYGSTVRGGTHRWSDLDMSYVPKHPDTWDCITVMVDDILFDLYPLHWPTLERMAEHGDWRATILDDLRVDYAASPAARDRLAALVERHHELEQPSARRQMVAKALTEFERVGYDYYQLTRTARTGEFRSACVHANRIIGILLRSLVVLNQSRADTRKLHEVMALDRIPPGLEELVDSVTTAATPTDLIAACDALLEAVRTLLLCEQAESQRVEPSIEARLGAAYPELRADVQRVLLACERHDLLAAQTKLYSFLHELHFHLAQGERGIEYSGFNSLDEYLSAEIETGFPDLVSPAVAGHFEKLQEETLRFDEILRAYLREAGAGLYCYESREDLERALRDARG